MSGLGPYAQTLMADKEVNKEVVRGYISPESRRLLKAVIGLRIDRDWTLSDVLEEAIQEWLNKPENREIIKKHRLDG